jgi:sigma-B regulation protein RsbU (phosphoserine phosphatase)
VSDESCRLEVTAEELFEDAPCGYLTTDLSGTIVRVNRTFERWMGLQRADLVGRVRFAELLSPGGRIYHETHYAPLLRLQGAVREIALELRRADGSLLAALVNSVLRRDEHGEARVIRTTIFDATERRRYERELLAARRREHEIAQELQRSLLAGALPHGPGFELAVHYAPAEAGLEVGGDWYDAFWLDQETLALVVGDVVGRGIQAAATMGQLRSAVRALASTGLAPGALLAAMDAFCHRHEIGHATTLLYAQLALGSGALCLACAGHPPPAQCPADGPARFLWEGRSWPLAVDMGDARRTQGEGTLEPGSVLLLYTDGLIERRDHSLGEGMDALLSALDPRGGAPVAELVASAAQTLSPAVPTDDICLLAVRRHG